MVTNSVVSIENEAKQCKPKIEKIYFLKTHKTASSTIENIMMRLAWNYNKTVARPYQGMNFDIYQPFNKRLVRPIPGLDKSFVPSILTQHTKFSKIIESMYPMSETYRFSILRGTGIVNFIVINVYLLGSRD